MTDHTITDTTPGAEPVTEPIDQDAPATPPAAQTAWGWRHTSWRRSSDERVISGVAGGVGAVLGVPTTYVRAGIVTLTLAGGVGAVLYGLAWLSASQTAPTASVPRDLDQRRALGLGLMFIAVLLTAHAAGLWLGDAVVWPVGLVAFGVAAIWDRSASGMAIVEGSGAAGPGRLRVLSGAILMLGGFAVLITRIDAMQGLGTVIIAVAITAAGFMMVFGSWVVGLAGELARERSDRIRTEERAEVAAHLHDSVLQTLALIQRSDDPRKMVTLARSQERELRTWLYGTRGGDEPTLDAALQAAAGKVEQSHDVPVEVVVVNDVAMTPRLDPLVSAATEAMNNAARHSGAPRVSVYAETLDGVIDVYVSDQGVGFDTAAAPPDRHGIRHSIVDRMERHGGSATVRSEPGDGTEVHLSMTVTAP